MFLQYIKFTIVIKTPKMCWDFPLDIPLFFSDFNLFFSYMKKGSCVRQWKLMLMMITWVGENNPLYFPAQNDRPSLLGKMWLGALLLCSNNNSHFFNPEDQESALQYTYIRLLSISWRKQIFYNIKTGNWSERDYVALENYREKNTI